MANESETDEVRKWHRRFAAECNNLTWDLIELSARNEADGQRMLQAAHAATFHWSVVGTALNVARAELTLARAYAVLGVGRPALFYAERFCHYCEANPVADWDKVFAQVALAHAAALLGDSETHRRSYEAATRAIAAIAGEGDRKVVQADLSRVPKPSPG